MTDTAFGMVVSFSASPQIAFEVGWAAESLVSGSQTVKQPSSTRAVGCCGLQRGLGMQHDRCVIPEVPHTYGVGQERLQSLCAQEGHPKSKIQHTARAGHSFSCPGEAGVDNLSPALSSSVRNQILDLSVSYCGSEAGRSVNFSM